MIGGTDQVGSAVVGQLAVAGFSVAIHHARHPELAEQIASALPGSGHRVFGADVGDPEALETLLDDVRSQLGGIDLVVYAAAVEGPAAPAIEDATAEQWVDAWTGALSVEILGAAAVARAAAAAFRSQGGPGRLIFVVARSGSTAIGDCTAAAVRALGSRLATDLKAYGIGVAVVGSRPGSDTGWSPAELAGLVALVASGPVGPTTGVLLSTG